MTAPTTEPHAFMKNMPDGRYELICTRCRISVIPHLPMSVTAFAKFAADFEKEHKNCTQESDNRE